VTPRRRSSRKAGWPANLYEDGGYYTYRNPKTDERFGLGRDRAYAFSQAIEANLYLAGQLHTERLIDRLSGDQSRTIATWCAKYEGMLTKRALAPNTRKHYRKLAARMTEILGADTKVRAVTALQVSDGLEQLVAQGHERTAQALFGFLRDSFNAAIVKGWLDENPVRAIKGPSVTVKRARLTYEVFAAVYASTDCTWLKNAMALAIVSAQRREDIALAQVKDIREGFWWVDQGKTGARICLPLELRLNCFGMSLEEVIRQCRSTGVLSRYLVHQTERVPGGKSTPGMKIWKDTISSRFTGALAALGLTFEDKNPPTFHEIRSLSARLYKKQGGVNTQELLGHKSASSTLLYEDGRGEWVRVRVGTV
jgi:integrase